MKIQRNKIKIINKWKKEEAKNKHKIFIFSGTCRIEIIVYKKTKKFKNT
jgi:hypothetical protein